MKKKTTPHTKQTRRERKEEKKSAALLGQLTTNKVVLVLSRKLFQCLAFGLRDQQGREDAGQHEESEDLETIKGKVCGQASIETIAIGERN